MAKKIVLLVFTTFFALALLPGGLGAWRQDLEINGTIHTGTWKLEKTAVFHNIPHDKLNTTNVLPVPNQEKEPRNFEHESVSSSTYKS
ncbi:hypothetical protein [Ammonifex thiophilus]|uniref:hypothetical protein n=1 Tax=Ammonifex thiophilus TaxID=444093 RepID=UPI00106AFF45|nr:hypothetical protein [Ammonifex thiophilus]